MGNASSSKQPKIKKVSPEEYSKLSKKRGAIAQEILQTERTYVRSLNTLVEIFIKPLGHKKIIKPEDCKTIFSITETILGLHQTILEELEKRVSQWKDDTTVADIFIQNASLLKMYTGYVNNYNTALSTLASLKEKNTEFRKFLEAASQTPECSGLDVTSYLIMPVQRIPRYVLLITELSKNSEAHNDYQKLQAALAGLKEVADHLNETKRNAENMQKIVQIQEQFHTKTYLNLVEPHRRFLNEGDLTYVVEKSKGGGTIKRKQKTIHYFLFNDIMVLAFWGKSFMGPEKWNLKELSLLNNLEIKDLEKENMVEVVTLEKNHKISFPTSQEKDAWITSVYLARSKAAGLRQTLTTEKLRETYTKATEETKEDKKSKKSKSKSTTTTTTTTTSTSQDGLEIIPKRETSIFSFGQTKKEPEPEKSAPLPPPEPEKPRQSFFGTAKKEPEVQEPLITKQSEKEEEEETYCFCLKKKKTKPQTNDEKSKK